MYLCICPTTPGSLLSFNALPSCLPIFQVPASSFFTDCFKASLSLSTSLSLLASGCSIHLKQTQKPQRCVMFSVDCFISVWPITGTEKHLLTPRIFCSSGFQTLTSASYCVPLLFHCSQLPSGVFLCHAHQQFPSRPCRMSDGRGVRNTDHLTPRSLKLLQLISWGRSHFFIRCWTLSPSGNPTERGPGGKLSSTKFTAFWKWSERETWWSSSNIETSAYFKQIQKQLNTYDNNQKALISKPENLLPIQPGGAEESTLKWSFFTRLRI